MKAFRGLNVWVKQNQSICFDKKDTHLEQRQFTLHLILYIGRSVKKDIFTVESLILAQDER